LLFGLSSSLLSTRVRCAFFGARDRHVHVCCVLVCLHKAQRYVIVDTHTHTCKDPCEHALSSTVRMSEALDRQQVSGAWACAHSTGLQTRVTQLLLLTWTLV
jgi:hypothetical protein